MAADLRASAIGLPEKKGRRSCGSSASTEDLGCSQDSCASSQGVLEQLRQKLPECWAHSLGFLDGRDLARTLAVDSSVHALGEQKPMVWLGTCQQLALHQVGGAALGCTGMRTLALWCLEAGSYALPGELAAGFAARALRDFKLQGWGPNAARMQARSAALELAASPLLVGAFTACHRSLQWRRERRGGGRRGAGAAGSSWTSSAGSAGSGDTAETTGGQDAGRQHFREVAAQENFSGYGQVVQSIEASLELRGCRLTMKASCESDVSSGCAGFCHLGVVDVHFFPSSSPPAAAQTILEWHQQDGDYGDDYEYSLDTALLDRVACCLCDNSLSSDCTASAEESLSTSPFQLSVAEALQLLWRILGAPFRWSRLCYPFAVEETFYLLLRNVFIRCMSPGLQTEEADEQPLFNCERSGADDSDFINDIAGLRQQLLGGQCRTSERSLVMRI